MKNQYFGDINDYHKYGLLRSIQEVSKLSILFAWMLTEDDGSNDGRRTEYLKQPESWAVYDPILFEWLQNNVAANDHRQVSLIENAGLFQPAKFFYDLVPADARIRRDWLERLANIASKTDLVFFDPDNGIEIRSISPGLRNSKKYVFWEELAKLWQQHNSILVYQHFPRESHHAFTQRMLQAMTDRLPGSCPIAFSTSHVLFLLALQPRHSHHACDITYKVRKSWRGRFKITILE